MTQPVLTDRQIAVAQRSRKLASGAIALSVLAYAYALAPLVIPQLAPLLTVRGQVIAAVVGGIIDKVGMYFLRDTGASTIPRKPVPPPMVEPEDR